MTFYADEPSSEDEELLYDDGFYVHHGLPLTFGGEIGDTFTPLKELSVNLAGEATSANPGLPPMYHVLLPPPTYYRLAAPVAGKVTAGTGVTAGASMFTSPTAPTSPFSPSPAAPSVDVEEPDEAELIPEEAEVTLSLAPAMLEGVDPLYPAILYVALSIGTLYINIDELTRYTILWTMLIGMGTFFTLIDTSEDTPPREMSPSSLGWGVSIGLVFSLPLFILISSGLADLVAVIFPGIGLATLFQSLAIVGPLGETLFFRGALQERRGFVVAVVGAALSSLIFYGPAVSGIYLVAVAIFTSVLAIVYSVIRARYGLGAAYASQVVANLLLLFLPAALG